ncbi:Mu transposase C-terminal domain-containing protein [Pseudomonas sp. Irchel 3A7]|uniref:Mu transposase C-terminal domain-containing protein n=1 Tax=Pseudomonas sp. Irchel 3A7 TaxID=2008913 RepID=UPI000BA374DE|nr:Mu transposase C-terminal domain-containing protein [Pseudomonas sp. Irchel 3A7]
MDKKPLGTEEAIENNLPSTEIIINPNHGIPRDWKESGVPPSKELIPYYERTIDEREEAIARERASIFDQVILGMSPQRGMSHLGLKHSQFYKLLNDYRNGKSLVRESKGTPKGSHRSTAGQIAALEKSFKNDYKGSKATISVLLKYARRYCDVSGERPVTRHAARRFLLAKPEKERDRQKLTEEAFNQKYGFRPKKLVIDLLLQRVSMDHTRVDLLLVDEQNRDVIIGRPWVTMILCDKSRVVLGFYLSLEAPNLDTVAAALAFAVLTKDFHLFTFLKNPNEYSFFGVPVVIFTDNAAEFTSERFIQQCREWGMEWDHRPKNKKWYGGIIERVIGTFMTTAVHFLPGSTGSNPVERESFESELNATMDFRQFTEWFLKQVTIYHGTIHRSLGCTPRQAWNHYRDQGKYDPTRVIDAKDQYRFILDFMPTGFDYKIHSYGINFAGRRFVCEELKKYVGSRLDIKYSRYDLSYIWAKTPDGFLKVPCSYTKDGLSLNWESYANHKQMSKRKEGLINMPSGVIDDEFAYDAMDHQAEIIQEAVALKTSFMNSPKPPVQSAPTVPAIDLAVVESNVSEAEVIDDSKIYTIMSADSAEQEQLLLPRIIEADLVEDIFVPRIIEDKD